MGLKTEGEKLCFESGLLAATVYAALHTGDPDSTNELSGDTYARVAMGAQRWVVDTTSGEASNAAPIVFPTPTATWSDPTHVAFWDQASGGNLLFSMPLTNDVPPPPADIEVSFPIGTVTVNLTTD